MKRAVMIVLGLLAVPAAAQGVRDDVLDSAARCSAIADDRAWLDCFYGAAQPMRARLGLTPAPQAQVRLVPPASAAAPVYRRATPPPKEKGFFAELLGSTKPVATNMPMAAYKFDSSGRFTVRLQNGETYVQEENDMVHAAWSGPPEQLLVTVNAAGDKYTLKVKSDRGAVYHARRR